MTNLVLAAAAALASWSLVMWVWMLRTRLPAMRKARMHPEKARHTGGATWEALPSEVRQVADNYNHLMEQPTIFYALALVIGVSGGAGIFDALFAWAYVAIRIVHSIWQASVNRVQTRFYLFVASTLMLFPLAVRALWLTLV